VAGEASFDRVSAEVPAGGRREQRVGRGAGTLGQPGNGLEPRLRERNSGGDRGFESASRAWGLPPGPYHYRMESL